MPGLLEQQQPIQPPADRPQQQPTQEAAQQPMPQEGMEPEQEGNPEALTAAMNAVRALLYPKKLGDKVAEVARTENPMPALTAMSYDLTQKADAQTGGNVPEEDIVTLGMFALSEVLDIADAAGAKITAAQAADALNQMVIRYLQEAGVSQDQIAQIKQAMAAVPSDEFEQLANQGRGEMEEPATENMQEGEAY